MRGFENLNYRQCVHCIMDTNDDPFITFNEEGVCNHCVEYAAEEKKEVIKGPEGQRRFEEYIDKIKASGKGKKYDCIIGISGGVDSSYLAYLAKQYGLRALGIHCDNGWNSELAVNNIQSIVSKLDMDLDTYVIDWQEFKDIQLSFFKANVIDIEAVSDLAFRAVLKQTAFKYKVKYFLSGDNVVTEFLLPHAWRFKNTGNLINIHKKFGTIPINTYPILSSFKLAYYDKVNPTENLALLNLVEYNKDQVKEVIKKELGWRDYGGKHFESIFTRFYQAYILPEKFGVDKRKAHLSNLICSGQMTRDQALEEMKRPGYDKDMLAVDKEFVLKKLGFTDTEFDAYLKHEPVPHTAYGVGKGVFEDYPFLKIFKPFVRLIK